MAWTSRNYPSRGRSTASGSAPLAIPLAASLDDWVDARLRVSTVDTADWKRLVAVVRGIDPEPLRDEIRSVWERPGALAKDELRTLAGSIDIRAQHPATLSSLAHTSSAANHWDAALRLLRDAQYAHPGDFWLNLELSLVLRGRPEEALRFNTAAVSIRPNSAVAHNNLGVALRGQNKLEEAAACYNRAIELEPKYALPYSNLSIVLLAQDKVDAAVAAARKAVELEPEYAHGQSSLGNALLAQNKLAEALAACRTATRLDPTSSYAYSSLGKVLYRQKQPDEAMGAFDKAIELDARNPAAHNGLGSILCDIKRDYEGLSPASARPWNSYRMVWRVGRTWATPTPA